MKIIRIYKQKHSGISRSSKTRKMNKQSSYFPLNSRVRAVGILRRGASPPNVPTAVFAKIADGISKKDVMSSSKSLILYAEIRDFLYCFGILIRNLLSKNCNIKKWEILETPI